mmetsp:Transcript_109546/g.285531  ORF Transcript_109546/g.285531 Transcript_109546/m.285531 type:complete len:98 (-) Transcript_109546:26-319(-)
MLRTSLEVLLLLLLTDLASCTGVHLGSVRAARKIFTSRQECEDMCKTVFFDALDPSECAARCSHVGTADGPGVGCGMLVQEMCMEIKVKDCANRCQE